MGSSKNDGLFSSPRQDVDHLDLVMECLEGGERLQRVNAGRFAEKDAADAAYQMLGEIVKTGTVSYDGVGWRELK